MKKTELAMTLSLALLILFLAGVQVVQAQYTEDGQPFILVSPINIVSPSNSTYSPQSLILNLTFKSFLDSSRANITIRYFIDGKTNTTIDVQATLIPMGIQSYYVITGWATLPEIPEGPHFITVYGKYEFPMYYHNIAYDNRTVYFTIDDGNPPIISNLSIENKTYSQDNLPLNFTVDEPTSWRGYCIDGQVNVTMTENSTLIKIPSGSHTLSIYANDTVGNMGVSEIISFNVAEPFPTLPVLTVSVALVMVVAGLLVYHKRKTKSESVNNS